MLTGQDRRNSGVIETAHIIPGIRSSLRMAWISYGSVDRLHVWEDFPAARQEALMQLVGYSWDQAGPALELLQGWPCPPYLGPRSLSFLHRFGIGLVPLGTHPDCHPGRATFGCHQTEKLLGFKMRRGHVAFGRVPGERQMAAAAEMPPLKSAGGCRTLYKLPPRVPLLSKKLYYGKVVLMIKSRCTSSVWSFAEVGSH